MTALGQVLHAKSIGDALRAIPNVFYERVALVTLGYWLLLPLPIWWFGDSLGLQTRFIGAADFQVAIVALAIGLLRLAARRAGADLCPRRGNLLHFLPLALFGVFAALAIIAAMVHPTSATLSGDWYREESIFSYISYIGFFYLASQVRTEARRARVLWLALGLVATTCVVTLVSAIYTGLTSGDWSGATQSTAYFYQFNHYGYLLAVGGALAAAGSLLAHRRPVRWGLLAIFGLVQLTLLLNDTLGAYLALLSGCLFAVVAVLLTGRRQFRAAIGLVAVAAALHTVTFALGTGAAVDMPTLEGDIRAVTEGGPNAAAAGTGRWRLWVATIKQIVSSPWLGHGVEGVAGVLQPTGRPHNEYLQYAAFFGIPALMAYLAAIASIFVQLVRSIASVDAATIIAATAAFTYLVSAAFGNTMFYTAPLLFLMLGIAWGGGWSPQEPHS